MGTTKEEVPLTSRKHPIVRFLESCRDSKVLKSSNVVLIVLAVVSAVSLLLVYSSIDETSTYYAHSSTFNKEQTQFFGDVLKAVRSFSVQGNELQLKDECASLKIGMKDVELFGRLNSKQLAKCVDISTQATNNITLLHKAFKLYLYDVIIDDFEMLPEFYKHDGIVILAGSGSLLNPAGVIFFLRNALENNPRKHLPIEVVFTEKTDAALEFCGGYVDQNQNVNCVFFDDIFDTETLATFTPAMHRPLALLVSSFSRVLLIGDKTLPLSLPIKMFHSNLFFDRGMILWPSNTRRMHHPKLYEFLDIKVDENVRVRYAVDDAIAPRLGVRPQLDSSFPLSDAMNSIPDMSTDPSIILIDKSKHLDLIIMALYFNYNGPKIYYPLLGYKDSADADKDTYALASFSLSPDKQRYYQVKKPSYYHDYWNTEIPAIKDALNIESLRDVGAIYHSYIEDERYSNVAQVIMESNQNAFYVQFANHWNSAVEDKLNSSSPDLKSKINDDEGMHKAFVDYYRKNYTIDEYMLLLHHSSPMFIDSSLVEASLKILPGFNSTDKLIKSGKFRMYKNDLAHIANIDIELYIWRFISQTFCTNRQPTNMKYTISYEPIGYMNWYERYRMCTYIANREYYFLNTWKSTAN
ncbi:HGL222Cp [Eremothecium sinecaudum]|uniref:HGL222Cp n=1 Tax=Eremothecium sinecaudum TaxID=45286 RepID=A0A0X8HVE0_9SACH|nr:HGL222Cp [Eremothecium sinecaudum]AMD22118.1 HGL222Cp [Eremothecium sinecaudum]